MGWSNERMKTSFRKVYSHCSSSPSRAGGNKGAIAHGPPTSPFPFWRKTVQLFYFLGAEKPNPAGFAASGRLKSVHFHMTCWVTPNSNVFFKKPPCCRLLWTLTLCSSEHNSRLIFQCLVFMCHFRFGFSPVHCLVLEGGSLLVSSFLCNFPSSSAHSLCASAHPPQSLCFKVLCDWISHLQMKIIIWLCIHCIGTSGCIDRQRGRRNSRGKQASWCKDYKWLTS